MPTYMYVAPPGGTGRVAGCYQRMSICRGGSFEPPLSFVRLLPQSSWLLSRLQRLELYRRGLMVVKRENDFLQNSHAQLT